MAGYKPGSSRTKPLWHMCLPKKTQNAPKVWSFGFTRAISPACLYGDRLVIIASFGGAPQNPPWYYNLLADPVVTVEVGVEKFKARTAQTSGAERQRLFDAQASLMPLFDVYQKKTRRQIPVLALTRIK